MYNEWRRAAAASTPRITRAPRNIWTILRSSALLALPAPAFHVFLFHHADVITRWPRRCDCEYKQAWAAVEYNIIRQREEFEKDRALAMRMEEII
jgi:hypothetical protein